MGGWGASQSGGTGGPCLSWGKGKDGECQKMALVG